MSQSTRSIKTKDIPFSRPSIGSAEIEAVAAVMKSGWLTTGPEAIAFEQEFAETVGARHALAVNSATAGLHLALEALGVGPGDHVIVPSLTFTATAEVVTYLGATVSLADVCRDTLLVTPETIDARAQQIRASGARVAAIIAVHLGGATCEIDKISDAVGVPVVEDAAHAFPAMTEGTFAGTLGSVGVFSFYANKTITTGEGGMVCTTDDQIAERVRIMRLHGIDRESWARYRDPRGSWFYDVVGAGYKYNMPDIAAAIGRVQLRRAESLRLQRREIAARYVRSLAPLGIAFPGAQPDYALGHAHHLCIAILPNRRDELAAYLRERGIGTSVHYRPLHRMSYWHAQTGVTDADLPFTAEVADRIVSLPLYPDMTSDEQDRVIEEIATFYG